MTDHDRPWQTMTDHDRPWLSGTIVEPRGLWQSNVCLKWLLKMVATGSANVPSVDSIVVVVFGIPYLWASLPLISWPPFQKNEAQPLSWDLSTKRVCPTPKSKHVSKKQVKSIGDRDDSQNKRIKKRNRLRVQNQAARCCKVLQGVASPCFHFVISESLKRQPSPTRLARKTRQQGTSVPRTKSSSIYDILWSIQEFIRHQIYSSLIPLYLHLLCIYLLYSISWKKDSWNFYCNPIPNHSLILASDSRVFPSALRRPCRSVPTCLC